MIPATVNIKKIIKNHPLVSKRLKELSDAIPRYKEREKARWATVEARRRGWIRASDSYHFTIARLQSEKEQLLSGGPFRGESQKAYLERCASIFIEAIYELEKTSDNDSAEHKRLERYLESINAQLSAPSISVSVEQTVNILMAMGVFV